MHDNAIINTIQIELIFDKQAETANLYANIIIFQNLLGRCTGTLKAYVNHLHYLI